MCERTISVTLLAALLLLPSCATKQTPYIPEETPPEDRHEEAPPREPGYDSSLDLPPESAFSGYPGDPLEIPFSLVEGSGDAKVTAEGEGAPELSFDSTTGEGTVTMTFPDTPGATCQATVTLTDGRKTCQYAIRATSYLFSVTAEAVSLEGGKGSSAFIQLSCETDIPGCELVYIPTEGFAVENGYVIALGDNDTPYPRTGSVLITESTRHFVGTTVTLTQEPLPPAPGPGVVAFAEWPFKLTMLELADTDGDGEVSYGEALSVREIVAAQKGIRDLTGLGAFRNAWKVDLRGNDIEDATVLRELPLLHWLDLRGNPRLRTFDVTGCSQYFEHCEFELTADLRYYTYRQQTGVTRYSDPSCMHSRHVSDDRKTSDWSHHKNLRKIQTHTRCVTAREFPWILTEGDYENSAHTQEGSVPVIVFTGEGHLDVDFNDGTWGRMMDRLMSEFWRCNTDFTRYRDYFDVYLLEFIVPDRNRYHCRMDAPYSSEEAQRAKKNMQDDWDEIARYAYGALFGETEGDCSVLSYIIDQDTFQAWTHPSKQYPEMVVVHLDNFPIYEPLVVNGYYAWVPSFAWWPDRESLSYRGYVANYWYSTHGRLGTDESDEYHFAYHGSDVPYGLGVPENVFTPSIDEVVELGTQMGTYRSTTRAVLEGIGFRERGSVR